MALRDNISGREYDKFVTTSDGTAIRVSTVAGGSIPSNLVFTSGTVASVSDTETVLVQKQTLNGRTGSWFVYNADTGAGGKDIDVRMYAAYASGAADWAQPATSATGWDVVGSTQNIAAGDTKHIPFNNVYRYVALTASTSTGTTLGVVAELYAL